MSNIQTHTNEVHELLTIHDDNRFPIEGRELHKALDIATPYDKWFPRMCEYGFEEGRDFSTKLSESTGGRPTMNHSFTMAMAKELCMIQRTEIGRSIRRYLISVEEAWNSPEQIMMRALLIAKDKLEQCERENAELLARNSELSAENQIMLPKAEYFDELVDRNLLTNFRETAKMLHMKERQFLRFLTEHEYVYRSKKNKILPCEAKNKGLFEVKECYSETNDWSGTQTLITPKGRETFRLLLLSDRLC